MSENRPVVVIARMLLPAGRDPLAGRFELREGGLEVTREKLLELVPGASALVADPSVPVDGELLDAAGDELRIVANFAVGHDNIDLKACSERGVVATNTPGVLTEATAELGLALTLAAARRMSDAERDLREGRWRGWDPAAHRGLELRGATAGVVGLGRIGRRYAELVRGMGAEVVYTARTRKQDAERELGTRMLELPALLEASEVVSLHAPSHPDTHRMIGAPELELIGPEGVFVNTSRGPLVDEDAVAAALESGALGAAGLDVYEREPEVSSRLLQAPRVVLLPHIGSATVKARDAMARAAAENVIAALEGRGAPNPIA